MNKLENNIWSFTNEVRGYIEISELKEIVVSLIFLKHATDEYLSNPFSEISVPKKSQYTFLMENLNNSDFLNYLKNAFSTIENENIQLRNTLTSFDFYHIFYRSKGLELVRILFIKISEFGLHEEELNFSDFSGELLSKFALSEGKKGGDINTPDSVSQLMVQLLNPVKGIVLDSTCGIGGFFQEVEDNYPNNKFKFYGQEYNGSTLALAKLRFAFNEKNAIQFGESQSTLRHDQFPELKADYVIMHPPFNVRTSADEIIESDPRFEYGLPPKSNANLAWVQHAIYHLKENGKAAILLSNGSLSSRVESQMRKNIIDADLVEAIITLPSQLFSNTSIPASIWLLSKDKVRKEEVLFIDASDLGEKKNRVQRELTKNNIDEIASQFRFWQENNLTFSNKIGFSNSVGISEIAQNDYLLAPSRYVGFKSQLVVDLNNAKPLSEVLKFDRPTKLQSNIKYKKASVKDLSNTPDSYILDVDILPYVGIKQNFKSLNNDVLLLSRIGPNIKPTFHGVSRSNIAYPSNYVLAFKVDESKVLLDYLVAELHKDYVKSQIESYSTGAAMPIISRKDLENIKIVIPELISEQKEIFDREREVRFKSFAKDLGFEKEIAKLKDSQMKDLGSKKHNIMQHLNNVKSSADVLTKMMEVNNGVLKADEVIDPRRGVTVEKRFLRLQESLEKVIYYVDNITNELKYDKAELINPISFIKECKERGIQNESYVVEIIVEKGSFQNREPLISISKNDFEEIYNNIIENAMIHGFIDANKSYIFRITISFVDGFLEINFENNGKPFPKGISEKYDVKGEKAGETGASGIGLWKVAEIVKHFGCKLEVFDEPNNEFPVGFKFKFNLETNE